MQVMPVTTTKQGQHERAPSLRSALSRAIEYDGKIGFGKYSPAIEETLSRMLCDAEGAFFVLLLISPACKLIETRAVARAATDGYHVYFNPDFFAKLTIGERMFVAAHEVCHVFLRHLQRAAAWVKSGMGPDGKPFHHETGNIAADYVINDMLVVAKVGTMPTEALWDRKIGTDGEAMEEVYLKLRKQAEEEQQQQRPSPEREEADSDDQDEQEAAQDDAGDEPGDEPGDDEGEGDSDGGEPGEGDEDGEGSEAEGTGTGGNRPSANQERPEWTPGARGSKGSGFDEHDIEAILEDLAKAQNAGKESERPSDEDVLRHILDAMEGAKMVGTMPGNFERLVAEIIKPPHDWEEIVRDELVPAIGTSEETYKRLSRPFISRRHPIIMPTYSGYATGTVVIIGDTSGSMGDEEMAKGFGVVAAILGDAKPEKVVVIWVDAEIHGVQEFTPEDVDDIANLLKPEGGGGTDMRLAYDWIENNILANGEEVSAVVLFSDGYTPFPETPLEGVHKSILVCTTDVQGPEWMVTVHADLASD